MISCAPGRFAVAAASLTISSSSSLPFTGTSTRCRGSGRIILTGRLLAFLGTPARRSSRGNYSPLPGRIITWLHEYLCTLEANARDGRRRQEQQGRGGRRRSGRHRAVVGRAAHEGL